MNVGLHETKLNFKPQLSLEFLPDLPSPQFRYPTPNPPFIMHDK